MGTAADRNGLNVSGAMRTDRQHTVADAAVGPFANGAVACAVPQLEAKWIQNRSGRGRTRNRDRRTDESTVSRDDLALEQDQLTRRVSGNGFGDTAGGDAE